MIRSFSGYGIGLLIGSVVFGGISFASTGVQAIHVRYANIQIKVDGKVIPTEAQPFIYHKNVYVPISTIGLGLGSHVQWVGGLDDVMVTEPGQSLEQSGSLSYDTSPVLWYGPTHTTYHNGSLEVSPIALASMMGEPFSYDASTHSFYIGQGDGSGLPLVHFPVVREYGDFASWSQGNIGPASGWNDGPPEIDGKVYANATGQSIVWSPVSDSSVVPGVVYNLRAKYAYLTGVFGMDSAVSSQNAVQLTVLGDGQQLYQSPWMTASEAGTPVAVNVSGIHLLSVEFAVKTADGTIYSMGQATPSSTVANADFLDVRVHS
ncbi:MAG: NPCBM/NEW2 domain-containing protein [Acidibacillus sp.]|uniref:NPCBM/NEW2 domain-containing protein n=1 Tax=Sulfoacidibacillus ferrooxidans TaxID=2005001 RepID=UPI001F506042|nr:NPCBM/NEW2 domain-containing protein [Acidibacillus sp.]